MSMLIALRNKTKSLKTLNDKEPERKDKVVYKENMFK